MDFEPMNFVKSLRYMGEGMFGIILVIGVIIGITMFLNFATKKKNKKND